MTDLPLQVLISPFVIALMAVALMSLMGRERKNAEPNGLVAVKDLTGSVKMRLLGYLGGHPDAPDFFLAPVIVLAKDGLLMFERRGRRVLATIPWASMEQWRIERLANFQAAASTVRGFDRSVLSELPADSLIARFRYRDERGWWQNVAFALHGPDVSEQVAAFELHVPTAAIALETLAPASDGSV